jgi:NTP pyrophosphatase (non-canonical NTP hydrolase)
MVGRLIVIKNEKRMTLEDIWKGYAESRKYEVPNTLESFLWLVSEIGELSESIVVNMKDGWVRNNPEKKPKVGDELTADEIGDVLMMLIATASAKGLDPIQCMLDKMKKKGFEVD